MNPANYEQHWNLSLACPTTFSSIKFNTTVWKWGPTLQPAWLGHKTGPTSKANTSRNKIFLKKKGFPSGSPLPVALNQPGCKCLLPSILTSKARIYDSLKSSELSICYSALLHKIHSSLKATLTAWSSLRSWSRKLSMRFVSQLPESRKRWQGYREQMLTNK